MGGYIGARAGTLSTTVANVQDVTATDTTPEVTIINNTHEDTDGGREGKVIFKGQQSGGEETTLAEIQGSHDGTADDEKGDLIFRTNDGSDGASPTERLRIDSDGSITTATLGTDNVHLGEGAGASIASGGNDNVTIGKDAGTAITTGERNTILGSKAGDAATTIDDAVLIGYNAGGGATMTGHDNIGVGASSLAATTTGSQNIAVGKNSGAAVTTGEYNVLMGHNSGLNLSDADYNVAIGGNALDADTKGSRSVAIGTGALGVQNFTSSTNSNNIAIGYAAGAAVTTGTHNTLVGTQVGEDTTDGARNTFIGSLAGANANADDSVCVGYNAGGGSAMTGHDNVIIGKDAAFGLTSGQKNVIIGKDACANSVALVGGQGNIMLGFSVRNNHINNDYCIGIGYNITTVGDNNFTFGRDASDSNIAFGATSITAPSDERYKEEIADSTAGLSFINDLRPVTFKWKKAKDVPSNHEAYIADGEEGCDDRVMLSNGETNHGFIAQEVKTAIDAHSEIKDGFGMWSEETREDADGNDITGGRQRVAPSELIPMLTKAIQELSAKNDALEAQNTTQATQIADLITRVTALEAE